MPDPSRMDLIAQAHQKWERDQLIASAHAKWDAENQQSQEPQTGAGQAALEHFGNAATMGYLPQLQAGAEKLMPNPSADVDAKLKAQGFKVQNNDPSYVQSRDANIKRMETESQEHPVASGLGTVGGVVSSGIALGGLSGAAKAGQATGTMAKGAAAAGRIIKGVKTGAAMGAIANPGDTEGEVNLGQLDQRLGNAKKGAILGGTLQGAFEAAPVVVKAIGAAGKKAASALSGLSEEQIAQYSKRTDEINQLIKSSGGEMTAAADQVRQEAQNSIRNTRAKYSSQIGKALEAAPKDPVADVSPVIEQLQKVKARLNPNLQSEAVGQIEDTIAKLTKESEAGGGKVSVQQLNQITDFLQGRGKSAYMQGGQIFQSSKEAAQAAKGAAAVSRKMLNSLSPEVAEANNKLALLHNLEDRLNPNLIAPGKPDSALFAAGAGGNPRNARVMEALGGASGYPLLERAKDLAAAKSFANPGIVPADATGKAVARQLLGAGAGTMIAGPLGTMIGGALASPATVKLAVNAGNVLRKAAPSVPGAVRSPMLAQTITQRAANAPVNQSAPADQNQKLFQSSNTERDVAQLKGEDKWAQKGAEKLGLSGDQADQLLQSREGKRLLIQASDLKPGSVAMKKIMDQIKKRTGK